MFDTFIFFWLFSWSLTGVFVADAVKSESVTEGESVSLNSSFTQIHRDEEIEWKFGDILIASVKNNKSKFYVESAEGRFRDRLKLDHQTGSLTIINSRTTDSGLYTVSSNKRNAFNKFKLTVYARLPVPVISRDCSSSSSCSLVCSAVNVSHVTLSWFKGNSSFSSISASDLSISLYLPLDVEYQDKNTYSCVINNPIRNQTRHLNITQLCHTCADRIHCCGFTEAVIRLALSALVGVATVAVLVYDIRSRSLQQKKSVQKYPSNSD
ncbi:SLAM family member 5-like [Chanodichthys erythropterus]|uniref:SLAM family member 5-like n=1 Tax=Chanodichthys erythropterus TaxID=933992 RepID=UPI00351DCDD0